MKVTRFLFSSMAILMVLAVSCKKVKVPSAAGSKATSTPVATAVPTAIVIVGPDSFEDDDVFGDASPITVNGSAQAHNSDIISDQDWVSFAVTLGTQYTITAASVGTTPMPWITLNEPDGFTFIVWGFTFTPGGTATITWTATLTGTVFVYYFDASGGSGANTEYLLSVTSP